MFILTIIGMVLGLVFQILTWLNSRAKAGKAVPDAVKEKLSKLLKRCETLRNACAVHGIKPADTDDGADTAVPTWVSSQLPKEGENDA